MHYTYKHRDELNVTKILNKWTAKSTKDNFLESISEDLYLMTLKSYAKFEQKLICCFKNDKHLIDFDPSTRKSQKFAL